MAKRILRYKGSVAKPTETTTTTRRVVFGKSREVVKRVWSISGRHSKPAMQRPFLTSATECREWLARQ